MKLIEERKLIGSRNSDDFDIRQCSYLTIFSGYKGKKLIVKNHDCQSGNLCKRKLFMAVTIMTRVLKRHVSLCSLVPCPAPHLTIWAWGESYNPTIWHLPAFSSTRVSIGNFRMKRLTVNNNRMGTSIKTQPHFAHQELCHSHKSLGNVCHKSCDKNSL